MNLLFWKKKPTPKPKPPKLSKISVLLADGTIVCHWARYRLFKPDGRLTLCNGEESDKLVAEYAAEKWVAWSTGKRSVKATMSESRAEYEAARRGKVPNA